MLKPIYFDYAATTPIDPRVFTQMHICLESNFGNPASAHHYGRQAKETVEEARTHIAELINAEPSEIIWTSGATESNNLAIKGVASLYRPRGKHLITFKTEHKAVLDPCQHLEKEAYLVTYLSPEPNGLIDINKLEAALRPETILVSVMAVNNETGVIQDLEAIAALTASRGILLHVDAAQAAGKIKIDLKKTPIDLMSLSAHKVYGPKGIGALYLRKRPRVRVQPLIHGGGHEQGMRSGTLATHQIAGMGEAFRLAKLKWEKEFQYISRCREIFLTQLENIPNLKRNTEISQAVPHILNMRFEGMLADALLKQLPCLAASTASACQGKGTEGSYVLRAMGLSLEQIKNSVRFSFGRFTTLTEIKTAGTAINRLFKITLNN